MKWIGNVNKIRIILSSLICFLFYFIIFLNWKLTFFHVYKSFWLVSKFIINLRLVRSIKLNNVDLFKNRIILRQLQLHVYSKDAGIPHAGFGMTFGEHSKTTNLLKITIKIKNLLFLTVIFESKEMMALGPNCLKMKEQKKRKFKKRKHTLIK